MTKLQCSWPAPVDIDGLGAEDKARIRKIGLKAWMEELRKASGGASDGQRVVRKPPTRQKSTERK